MLLIVSNMQIFIADVELLLPYSLNIFLDKPVRCLGLDGVKFLSSVEKKETNFKINSITG